MIQLIPWVERKWSFDLPVATFPMVLERLRGTPARAAELVAGAPDEVLSARPSAKWSVKEHLGHLSDLHQLDVRRVNEFRSGAPALSAADMSNRRTEEAGHRSVPVEEILVALHRERQQLMAMLEDLTEADVAATALHPRLRVPIRLIDWAEFVAEHDDHHLAWARATLRVALGTAR